MTKHPVLIVEDDPDIVELITLDLSELGLNYEVARDGETGFAIASAKDFSLVLLDLMLPGMDGIEVCRRLRMLKPDQAIMILTGKDDDVSLALGFETGADEYLKKPFKSFELKARVRALLRRSGQSRAQLNGKISFGPLTIDTHSCEVTLDGRPIELTKLEYDLLVFLSANAGRVLSRNELLEGVWGAEFCQGYELNINTHISRLRSKLRSEHRTEDYIKTLRGLGYRFVRDDEI